MGSGAERRHGSSVAEFLAGGVESDLLVEVGCGETVESLRDAADPGQEEEALAFFVAPRVDEGDHCRYEAS